MQRVDGFVSLHVRVGPLPVYENSQSMYVVVRRSASPVFPRCFVRCIVLVRPRQRPNNERYCCLCITNACVPCRKVVGPSVRRNC